MNTSGNPPKQYAPETNMHLLNTFDTKEDADDAAATVRGRFRIASERDDTTTIYNLFGDATWHNLYNLKMYNLIKLKELLTCRSEWREPEHELYSEILKGLETVSKKYQLPIPSHWK